jgi:hypothetical protein
MVGATIATALRGSTSTDMFGGHLPVFLDLRVPPVLSAPAQVDFGQVPLNSLGQFTLTVSNAGDVAKWTAAGIANLVYTLSPSAGLSAPLGNQVALPGTPGNNHTITVDTSSPGPFLGSITINSNAPDLPSMLVNIIGEIVEAACYANCDGSTTPPILNVQDFSCFLNAFAAGDTYANCDLSTTAPILNVQDFSCFLNAFAAGCS